MNKPSVVELEVVKDGRYNRSICLPPRHIYASCLGVQMLDFGPHALEAARYDSHGSITVPRAVYIQSPHIVEVIVKDGRLQRILVRVSYEQDPRFDLALALAAPVPGRPLFVITCWLNYRNDAHRKVKFPELYVHN